MDASYPRSVTSFMCMPRVSCLLLVAAAATSSTLDAESVAECDGASGGSAMLQQTALGTHEVASHSPQTFKVLTTWREALDSDPGLFTGCSKIFLDVGANRGTHVRKLYEPTRYAGSEYLRFFDEYFGDADNRTRKSSETGICAFGFEGNPRWTKRLNEIESKYTEKGWRVKYFVPEAAGGSNGETKFFINDYADPMKNGKNDLAASRLQLDEWAAELTVPSMDFSEFIEAMHVLAPAGPKVVKMDIESGEYDALKPFLAKQLLCKSVLDVITVDWHAEFFKDDDPKREEAKAFREKLESGKICKKGEPTRVAYYHDQDYIEDGIALPR